MTAALGLPAAAISGVTVWHGASSSSSDCCKSVASTSSSSWKNVLRNSNAAYLSILYTPSSNRCRNLKQGLRQTVIVSAAADGDDELQEENDTPSSSGSSVQVITTPDPIPNPNPNPGNSEEVATPSSEQITSNKQESKGPAVGSTTIKKQQLTLDAVNPVGLGRKARQLVDEKNITLDDVNPVGLGRKARQLYDDVWKRLTELGQLNRSYDEDYDEVLVGGPMCDFTTPNAELTTVLVAGATGRVGRILIRKLQLRGYKVKALVRKADPETLEMLPRSVQVVVGDLGDPDSLKEAVEGCNKIICCATARSDITGDLLRVDNRGVYNLSKAFQDYNHKLAQTRAGRSSKSKLLIAKFSQSSTQEGLELKEGTYFTDDVSVKYDGGMDAQLEVGEDGNAVFSGYVFTRGGYVELAKKISLPPGLTLDRYEGLLLSVCGDGKSYSLLLETYDGERNSVPRQYFARFPTRLGFSRIRVPFSTFRPMKPEDPPLDPFFVQSLSIRFEPRRLKAAARADGQDPRDQTSFRLVLDYIKALPGGQETDFILVSCAGAGIQDSERRSKLVRAKQAGEAALRNSGLGYTIVRPGPLQEEPGGQKALVFDQGDRITQGISCADVADVCVKALHNPTARNKSFDVCHEYTSEEGQGLYELVAHLPDKSNNYLTPALAVLEKNT
ncbi:hypothetical protein R1sor_006306 [Riccia sorocarpa]|uniref:Uncharacterized protein n=1 Tax=Riccia sorocarpa TaxID=122646 RepID=A0ABD3HM53_9MARC